MPLRVRQLMDHVKTPLRPAVRWIRHRWYRTRFQQAYRRLQRTLNKPIALTDSVGTGAGADELWNRALRRVPPQVYAFEFSLDTSAVQTKYDAYWQECVQHYRRVSQAREKALEHMLTFQFLDFTRVRRYCDVAAATSPIEHVLRMKLPSVEYWKQDLLFTTDVAAHVVGGFAQDMRQIENGFFDALTLHCSFEHFEGDSDVDFLAEVDRILSPVGACLILPLYLAETHRTYFDPTMVSASELETYDSESDLIAAFGYRQSHGRFYSPETLATRLLEKLPPALRATLMKFRNQGAIDPGVSLQFALVLHRSESIFIAPPANRAT